mmetsp:Transcript_48303/g.154888  ORF Transcript_48303/g.154888 Transcript_48303/m.154888 type:complete len:275 (+) Transcript_48303:73-897(+)
MGAETVSMQVAAAAAFPEPTEPSAKRPHMLLRSPEALRLIGMLGRLEGVTVMGNNTGLGIILSAAVASLYRFTPPSLADKAENSKLPPEVELAAPPELKGELVRVRQALDPELLFVAFVGSNDPATGKVTKDWRPLVYALQRASSRLHELVDKAVNWNQVVPEALSRASGIGREELREAVVACVRLATAAEPGSWTNRELEVAERMVQEDPVLQKVAARADTVVANMGDSVQGLLALVPIAFFALLALVGWCAFGGANGGSAPVDELPMLTLKS